MSLSKILALIIPLYKDNYKFRACLYIREYLRKKELFIIGDMLRAYMLRCFGCEISPKAEISPKISVMHTIGIVIGEGVIIKEGCTIYQHVTLGRKNLNVNEYPTIEENVIIYSGSTILGKVNIAKGSIIGASSLVITDTEEYGLYIGSPAKFIKCFDTSQDNQNDIKR